MNWNWLANQVTRICLAGLLVTLAVSVSHAAAPLLPVCSWPFEVSGQGLTNIATPDTNATYWVMPLDTSNWKAIVIHGTYPQARFFNFNTYTATGSLIGTLYDAQIALIVGVGIRLRRRPAPEPRTIRSRSAPIIWDRTIPSALEAAASPLSCIASIWLTQGWTEPAASASLR
jgi:hypothetical protein